MGFLLGAFGKLAAGSRYRDLQARMMRVQSRLRRASRNVADKEKSLDRQKKAELNSLTMMSNSAMVGLQAGLQTAAYNSAMAKLGIAPADYESLKKADLNDDERNALNQYNSGMQMFKSSQEMYTSQMKQYIEDKYEYLHDTQLDPLKDEEDSLQLEKDTLESQLQIAKADYEACQKMEQSDAQMMKPNYTGGQG